jgi:hypothetical protein
MWTMSTVEISMFLTLIVVLSRCCPDGANDRDCAGPRRVNVFRFSNRWRTIDETELPRECEFFAF